MARYNTDALKNLSGEGLISNKFIQVDKTTPITLPGEMEGWLAQNNLARFVVEIVEQLDTSTIEEDYRGCDRRQ